MNIRFVLIPMLVLALIADTAVAAERLSHSPGELGKVILDELTVRDGKVIIRVASNGCTDKADIRANVRKQEGIIERIPHYVVTFERIRVDDCKALFNDGVVLEYDLAQELRLPVHATLSVTNWVYAQSSETSENDWILRRHLRAATIRAIELETRAVEDKHKTAEAGVGPAANADRFRKQLAELSNHLQTFQRMSPPDYPSPTAAVPAPEEALAETWGPVLPARRLTVTVRLEEECREGNLLNVEGMTKSGPFYHVAGISTVARRKLKIGQRQELVLYLVYKRDYFGRIPNYVVFIAEVK